ncbi:MAG TPA: hypothetical protein VGN76_05680 [Gemmatimonadales bacterium]|nr:hypothetical protein [Gemmatimonadales bacterium]
MPSTLRAQTSAWFRIGANGIPAYTLVDPVPGGNSLGEIRLVQPTVMAHAGAFSNRLRLVATLNLEGLTIPDGELALGDWGEGFMDRRHPHTYAHELVLTYAESLGRSVRASLSAGKGFVPFGTDDPMVRPIFRYPVNHHLAQILERAVAIVGVRSGPLLVEGGLFNGDEPERPEQWPLISRFGDSWSARVTLLPIRQLELQGSHAEVHSPEHRPGSGTDQDKWSLSARWEGAVQRHPVYGLLEWARTSEANGFFVFRSVLAEGAWTWGRSRLHYRFECTDRPEEERTLSPFRSLRPHLENSILGETRWTIHTAGYGYQLQPFEPVSAFPFVELSYGRIATVEGGLFDPASFYGKTSFWSVSIGVRLNLGMRLHRMGRYGVAQDTANAMQMPQHEQHDH